MIQALLRCPGRLEYLEALHTELQQIQAYWLRDHASPDAIFEALELALRNAGGQVFFLQKCDCRSRVSDVLHLAATATERPSRASRHQAFSLSLRDRRGRLPAARDFHETL
eukprot:6398771-Pyramimonas_sp.AAC.1